MTRPTILAAVALISHRGHLPSRAARIAMRLAHLEVRTTFADSDRIGPGH